MEQKVGKKSFALQVLKRKRKESWRKKQKLTRAGAAYLRCALRTIIEPKLTPDKQRARLCRLQCFGIRADAGRYTGQACAQPQAVQQRTANQAFMPVVRCTRCVSTHSSTSMSKEHVAPSLASVIWQPSTSTLLPSYRRLYSTTCFPMFGVSIVCFQEKVTRVPRVVCGSTRAWFWCIRYARISLLVRSLHSSKREKRNLDVGNTYPTNFTLKCHVTPTCQTLSHTKPGSPTAGTCTEEHPHKHIQAEKHNDRHQNVARSKHFLKQTPLDRPLHTSTPCRSASPPHMRLRDVCCVSTC